MRNREIKRDEILRAGARIMYLKGYNGTGVKQIVDAAGVPKGSFYNYFASKEDFALQALRFFAAEELNGFAEILEDRACSPRERIIALFERRIAAITREGSFTGGCFLGNLCQEMADTCANIGMETERHFEHHKTLLAECLRQAQNAGQLAPEQNPDELAEFIFNSWEGTLMRMKACKNSKPLTVFLTVLKDGLLR